MPGGSSIIAGVGGFGLRRLARTLSEGFGNKGDVNQSRPYSDPAMQSALNLLSFWVGPTLAHGVVTDTTAVGHCYRVQLEKAHQPIVCTVAGLGVNHAAGVRDLSTIQAGVKVLVSRHPQQHYGVIICTLPPATFEGKLQLHQQICHASRNRVDEAHLQPFKQGGKGYVTSWTAGRPFDSTTVGEKGFISETGTRMFVDSFMAHLGVDEACGVFAFMHDQLLRIAGYNLRMFSAGMEREGMDDQEEYNDWTGYTPYPWEQLGMFERKDPRRQLSPEQWQIDEPWYGPWELIDDLQRPWHREREYHGYLGQGGKRTVKAPPISPPAMAAFLQDDIQFPGLADDYTGLDGRRMISTAKGVSIVKRVAVQAPVRRYIPEQVSDEGDSPDNYRHAGLLGDGPEHVIKGEIETQGDFPELNRAAGVLDLHAYWFNYGCFHPFFFHEKDWSVFSEDKLEHTEGVTIKIPDYDLLASSVYLQAPEPLKLDIDHRLKQVKYWQNECGIDLLEDGGVVIYDGWGSEIRMTAGSVWISAAGDAWLNPGRNVNIWGGDDVNIRAKNSCDIVTSKKDIRIKSERNLHALAGNSGEGGVLLESRAIDKFEFKDKCGEDVVSGGVFLRAEQGTVGAWASNVYLRTGSEGGDIPDGNIVLDAGKGRGALVTYSNSHTHFVDQAVQWHFACDDGDCQGPSATITPSGTAWPGYMCNGGGAVFGGSVDVDGAVAAQIGYVAEVNFPFVAQLTDQPLIDFRRRVDDCQERINETIPSWGREFYDEVLEPLIYADDKPGHKDVIQNAEVSLRTVQQYGAKDFALYESRWQMLGRKAGKLQNTWPERPVECRGQGNTYPYPGKENFETSEGNGKLVEQDVEIFEISGDAGRASSHGSQPDLSGKYLDPKYPEPRKMSLEQYRVIVE